MKKKLLLLLGVCLLVMYSSSVFAAVMLKRLGDHPFSQPAMTTEADLRAMVEARSADIQVGFEQAGMPELYPEFMAQFPNAQIELVQIPPGAQFEWMIFRKNGKGPVKVVKDVTWDGEAAFDAFKFSIDKDGQRYEFIVAALCGNLSLSGVNPVPVAANQNPVCNMTLSSSELKCGEVVTVDASGSTDPEGTISKVIFRLMDASNQVVTEVVDTEAPFVQEFTIPCESSQYTVKAVVVDNMGAESSPTDCTQTVKVAEGRRGGWVIDGGYAHVFDPADYLFARGGYEYPLTDRLTAMGLLGGFVRLDEDDDDDVIDDDDDLDDAFTADALLNYYFNEKMFVGGGIGLWAGDDSDLDLIVNMGYLVYERPGMKTSIFVEGRCFADELISSTASRLGVGVRFQF